MGTYRLPSEVDIRELTPKRYDAMTDGEVYAEIDKMLADDPNPEGRNDLLFSFRRLRRKEQVLPVLESLGFSGDSDDYSFGYATGTVLMVRTTAPAEDLREALFRLYRCAEIGTVYTHAKEVSYPV